MTRPPSPPNSGTAAKARGGADNLGAVVKFAVPTIANGEVFVGTTDSLVIYGLTRPPTRCRRPPSSRHRLSGSSINLTWTDSTTTPNTATGYDIEESTNDVNFTQVATTPGRRDLDRRLRPDPYDFRIRGFNSVGDSPYSNTATATTTTSQAGSARLLQRLCRLQRRTYVQWECQNRWH